MAGVLTVGTALASERSAKLLLWQVSSTVPSTSPKGVLDGVKFAVYTARPLTTRMFEIQPENLNVSVLGRATIMVPAEMLVVLAADATRKPFKYT